MGTSVNDIKEWYDRGVERQATHMIIVCDTFDWDDYPIYVKVGENVHSMYDKYNGPNMQKVMEVYKLTEPFEPQSAIPRCFNF